MKFPCRLHGVPALGDGLKGLPSQVTEETGYRNPIALTGSAGEWYFETPSSPLHRLELTELIDVHVENEKKKKIHHIQKT